MAKQHGGTNPGVAAPSGSTPAAKSLFRQCMDAIQAGDDETTKRIAADQLQHLISTSSASDNQVLILFDEEAISDFHADNLYAAALEIVDHDKPILLILHSPGGSIEPAYLISKALKKLSNNSFKVAVPRRAKSAATLLALGAHEIHLGMMSQLGPIDPQFGGLPALALANALDVIAEVSCKFPGATDMLSKYLTQQISIRHLGYFQRINESAIQYAERLLADKVLPTGSTPESIGQHLVNYYKDHNFVIDADEANTLLGPHIVKENTAEYHLSDSIFKFLDLVTFFTEDRGKRFFWVGQAKEQGAFIWAKPSASSSSTMVSQSR